MSPKQSNKTTFAALVIVAIIAAIGLVGLTSSQSLSNIWYFTGFGTTALGTATVNITGGLSIVLSDMNITFGNGTFIAPGLFAILESNNSDAINGTWANVNDYFVLENDGNVNVNITIKASNSAGTWFGGNANYAAMWYMHNESEPRSCLFDATGIKNMTWMILPVDPLYNGTCQTLNYSDASDTMRVYMKIQIPADAVPGLKANSITFSGSQSA